MVEENCLKSSCIGGKTLQLTGDVGDRAVSWREKRESVPFSIQGLKQGGVRRGIRSGIIDRHLDLRGDGFE